MLFNFQLNLNVDKATYMEKMTLPECLNCINIFIAQVGVIL